MFSTDEIQHFCKTKKNPKKTILNKLCKQTSLSNEQMEINGFIRELYFYSYK